MEQVRYAIEAAARLSLALEGRIQLEMDELEDCVDCLVLLIEESNDELKPLAEERARARKA